MILTALAELTKLYHGCMISTPTLAKANFALNAAFSYLPELVWRYMEHILVSDSNLHIFGYTTSQMSYQNSIILSELLTVMWEEIGRHSQETDKYHCHCVIVQFFGHFQHTKQASF